MSTPAGRVVRVLPDVPAIDKEFDYLVPEGVDARPGDVVRIELHGRRVGGWIVADDVESEPGVVLKPLAKVSGRGPGPDLIDLAGWAAWRWAGRRASFLRTAAPPAVVRSVPGSAGPPPATGHERTVRRLGPGADRYGPVRDAIVDQRAVGGQTLVLCPSVGEARTLGRRLRADGVRVALVAHDEGGAAAAGEWAHAAGGAEAVVGARAGAWAPAPALARVIVLDEHDERYQQEQTPSWHARDVAVERARRAEAPAELVSPCPTLEALAWGELVVPDRPVERRSWPRVEVVDQRDLDPALGPLFSPRLVDLLRRDGTVVCVLNRTGRARLLACRACATLARCEVCDAAVAVGDDPDRFVCGRCDTERPAVCLSCGGSGFKQLRLGVSRAREELEALAGEPVADVTASTPPDDPALARARIAIGTEAILHRYARADAVAFLDFDQELLALRYRAAEQALGLLAHAGRLVARAPSGDGRILVQTRTPDHPAVLAAVGADPDRLVRAELPLRQTLGLPPATAMALVSGEAAEAFVDALGEPLGVRIQGPVDGAWRLVAPDHGVLCDALAAVARPPGRLRLEVDPLRV